MWLGNTTRLLPCQIPRRHLGSPSEAEWLPSRPPSPQIHPEPWRAERPTVSAPRLTKNKSVAVIVVPLSRYDMAVMLFSLRLQNHNSVKLSYDDSFNFPSYLPPCISTRRQTLNSGSSFLQVGFREI